MSVCHSTFKVIWNLVKRRLFENFHKFLYYFFYKSSIFAKFGGSLEISFRFEYSDLLPKSVKFCEMGGLKFLFLQYCNNAVEPLQDFALWHIRNYLRHGRDLKSLRIKNSTNGKLPNSLSHCRSIFFERVMAEWFLCRILHCSPLFKTIIFTPFSFFFVFLS